MLETNSHGFATTSDTSSHRDEVVVLSETSSVMELLLQFLYPGPHPDLAKVKLTNLAGLAEAAQKYRVWSAMEITNMQMQ